MLVHLAKVAIMFGLRSSGGSYEKMRSEYQIDVENPFSLEVGYMGAGYSETISHATTVLVSFLTLFCCLTTV